MPQTYKYGVSEQLTPHFNAKEFTCKCGRTHDTIISDKLVTKLEELYKKLENTPNGVSKIIVTSGYRCKDHDIAVGGNGYGQHTLGNAADICCYDKNNNKISSKIICCIAQDLDFRGISNIDSTYNYTHVDVRDTGTWYGDEVITTAQSVCMSFWKYYNMTRDIVYGTRKQMKITVEYDDHIYSGLLEER